MINSKHILVVCTIAVWAIGEYDAKAAITSDTATKKVIFTKVDYEVNKDFMDMEVILKNRTDARPAVDLNAELYVDINDALYVNNIVSRKASELEYHALIKSGRISLCDFFKNPDREPFLKMLFETLQKYGQMMFKCPVKKGKYFLKEFQMDASNLPSFTPTGDYRVDFTVTKKENDLYIPIYRMLWYAKVVE